MPWYLQQYAQQWAFSAGRAHTAEAVISGYAPAVIKQLGLEEEIRPSVSGDGSTVVSIRVSEIGVTSGSTIHQLLWELLEDSKIWSIPTASVHVERLIPSNDSPAATQLSNMNHTPFWASAPDTQTINILLVVARDLAQGTSAYEDINPFLSSTILARIRDQLQASENSVRFRLDIVRPGTFAALESHLNQAKGRFGPGYYGIVHFDMHGSVKREKDESM